MIPETFFDWTQLGTYAGATVAVMLFVEFTKELPFIKNIPTRLWAYIMAVLVLILSTIFTGQIDAHTVFLCLFNAVIVAMAAVGGYDITHKIKAQDQDGIMRSDFDLIVHKLPSAPEDLHVGAIECNRRQWEDFCGKVLADKHAYICILGDLLDNGTKQSVTNCFDAPTGAEEVPDELPETIVRAHPVRLSRKP